MTTTPLVSICIPCHNAGNYLREAIDSVLQQTWGNVQVIVVEDSSTDNSAQILRSVSDQRVQVIAARCGNAAKSRNLAARSADGEYIKFFDADDLMSPGLIEAQVKRLQAAPGSIASAKWGRFYQDDIKTFRESPESVWADLEGTTWLIQSWRDARPMMQPGIFLIPRAHWLKCGEWNESLSLIDDFEYYSRIISAADQVLFCPDETLFYRSGLTGSLSGRKSREAVESAFHSLLLGTQHLLEKRNDTATRLSCANMLQDFIYSQYPAHADLRKALSDRIAEIGGSNLAASGPPKFELLKNILGWKLARRIERIARR